MYVMAAVLGVMAVLLVYAFVQHPPAAVEEHDHEAEQESQVISGTLQEINLSKAKVVKIQPNELADANCANQIANSLVELKAIGEVTVDLVAKTVTVQYDSSKTDENKILAAFAVSQHEGTVIESAK